MGVGLTEFNTISNTVAEAKLQGGVLAITLCCLAPVPQVAERPQAG